MNARSKRIAIASAVALLAAVGPKSAAAQAASNTCKLGMFLPVGDDEVDDLLAAAGKDKRGPKKQAIKSQPVELPREAARDAPAPTEGAPR